MSGVTEGDGLLVRHGSVALAIRLARTVLACCRPDRINPLCDTHWASFKIHEAMQHPSLTAQDQHHRAPAAPPLLALPPPPEPRLRDQR